MGRLYNMAHHHADRLVLQFDQVRFILLFHTPGFDDDFSQERLFMILYDYNQSPTLFYF